MCIGSSSGFSLWRHYTAQPTAAKLPNCGSGQTELSTLSNWPTCTMGTARRTMPTQTRSGGLGLLHYVRLQVLFTLIRLPSMTAQVVESILALERPDLAVLSGDMVSGFMWDTKPGWFEKRYEPAQGLQHHPDSVHARESHMTNPRACAGGGS